MRKGEAVRTHVFSNDDYPYHKSLVALFVIRGALHTYIDCSRRIGRKKEEERCRNDSGDTEEEETQHRARMTM